MPLVFPGSDNLDEDHDPNELTFRDGKRVVAPYLTALMGSLDTERLTYDEALAAMNRGLLNDHLNHAYDSVLETHRKNWSR